MGNFFYLFLFFIKCFVVVVSVDLGFSLVFLLLFNNLCILCVYVYMHFNHFYIGRQKIYFLFFTKGLSPIDVMDFDWTKTD